MSIDYIDKLVISGLGVLDGEYSFNLVELLTKGSPEYFTLRELHQIKVWSSVREGELGEAFDAEDSDLTMTIAAIIMQRAGKRVYHDVLLDAPGSTEMRFVVADRAPKDEVDADIPPVSERPESDTNGTQLSDGNESSGMSWASLGTDQSRTGALGLALSGHQTSET